MPVEKEAGNKTVSEGECTVIKVEEVCGVMCAEKIVGQER